MLSTRRKPFLGTSTALVVVALVAAMVVAAVASAGARSADAQPAGAQLRPGVKDPSGTRTNPFEYKFKDARFNRSETADELKVMARCDDGYDAIGGGFDKHRDGGGTFGMRPTTSRPSVPSMDEGTRPGEGWVAVFHRERGGPAGVEVSAYVVCAPREDVPEPGVYLAEQEKTIPPTYIQTYTPSCRGNDWAIGGGYDFFGDDYVALVRSQHNPGDKLHSWLLAATTDHRFKSIKVKAYAVCVPKEFLRELHVREAADTSGAGSGNPFAEATTPKCPNGTYLLGGGAGMPNRDAAGTGGIGLPDLIRISPGKGPRENPPWKPETWQAKVMKNSSLFPLRITIHAFAMCGELSDQRADGKLSGKNPGWGDGMGGGRFK